MGDYNQIYNKMLYGGASGFISTLCIYPVDTLRSLVQSNTGGVSYKKYLKPIHALGLYRGFSFNLAYVIPEKAIKIGLNDYLVSKNLCQNKTINHIQSGIAAGFVQSFITSPSELIKIRKQVYKNTNYMDIIRTAPNLFRGLHLTVARDVPFTGIFFPIYYSLKNENESFLSNMRSGLLAATISTAVVTPIDAIKTNYQLNDKDSTLDVIRRIKSNGKYAFTRGIFPRMITISVLYSITMGSFEYLKKNFNK